MCNAYNHPSNCACGWGGDCHAGGGHNGPIPKWDNSNSSPVIRTDNYQPEYFSFTNPNATCPICGAQVYYYQNCHGSKVYFDELGKPWPKHACLTNEKISSMRFDRKDLKFSYDIYDSIFMLRPIHLLKCDKNGKYFRLLFKTRRKVFSFFTKEQLFPIDLLFFETREGVNYIHGFRELAFELKLYKINEIEK